VDIIESWAEANNTITAIESKFDLLCALVPAFEGVCEGIVDFDVKGVVGYLEKNGDSNTVCKKIGVCGGLKLQGTRNNLNADGYCNYCEYFFGVMESFASSGAGESDIFGYLDLLCSLFPSETICQYGIAGAAPYLFSYVTAYADPSTVCYDLGACEYPSNDEWNQHSEESTAQDPASEYEESYDIEHYEEDDNWDDDGDWKKRAAHNTLHPEDTCSYCSLVVSWLSGYMDSDTGAAEVTEIMDNYVCSVTQNMQYICSTLVSEMETIFQYVALQESPQNICYNINLCSDSDFLFDTLKDKVLELEN